MKRTYKEEKFIEDAVKFLISAFEKSGRNPKPVVLHSIRVGMYLENLRYGTEIVVGALLHDLLEDTETTADEIEQRFKSSIRKLVEANTLNKEIKDKTEQYKDSFERCKKAGKNALIIKAADILDNSNYYNNNRDLWSKAKYFRDFTKSELSGEKVWKDLNKMISRVK